MKLFISSTWADLKDYVGEAERVLEAAHITYVQFKHWESTGRPSVSECLDRVDECHALIVLVGVDYGWVPPEEQGGDGQSSITWLEVQRARNAPKPVLPFFIEDASLSARPASQQDRERFAEFVAEMRKGVGPTVGSIAAFGGSLRMSVEKLQATLAIPCSVPPKVGEPTQAVGLTFLDREQQRAQLLDALTNTTVRGATIVGKGGFGKSALANDAIKSLRDREAVDTVIYLTSSKETKIDQYEYQVYTSTMRASGQPPLMYEGSWATLKARTSELVRVLLGVYRRHRIVLYLDAFEHMLDCNGAVRSETLRSFLESFLLAEHPSKMLITTRQPALSANEISVVTEVSLDDGLPVSQGAALLKGKLPAKHALSDGRIDEIVRSANGIPFLLERLPELLRRNPMLDLTGLVSRELTLDEVVARMHSSLSRHASLVLQARSVFDVDDAVLPEAIEHVLPELDAVAVGDALAELGRGSFLFPVEGGRLGIHELDHDAAYRALEHGNLLDRNVAHRRAAAYYARSCAEGEQWFEWTSIEELRSDIQRFAQLVRAGDHAAAVRSINIGKIEFLNWTGHVDRVKAMFTGLQLPKDDEEVLLVQRFALGDGLVVTGPFDRAVEELEYVIERSKATGQIVLELNATYEIGLAYRYIGQNKEAVKAMRSMVECVRARGDERWAAYSLYGYSLACAYADEYIEAIQAGRELVRYGRSAADSWVVGRGNSSLCLPYFLLGMMEEAEICAKESAAEFLNTRDEYVVGYIENVHGLALHGLGRIEDALKAFEQASIVGRRTWQRRAEALAATNRAWVLYERGDFADAVRSAKSAIDQFDQISADDAKIVRHLHAAFAWAAARGRDRAEEGRALWSFVEAPFRNPDLVRRTTVAGRILELGAPVDAETLRACDAFIQSERAEIDRTLAVL